ncbi:hypothetical protein ASG22_08580 [Chryseobacterium sp. Leaf405]|uniref:glycosyltransferase n=1 Tax=Chryseobacterium sp. Leaf405 TaxID=1736367 RepID=UPI0007007D5E|nr:glycosyltransferase [Chryseobacterium sp. Leaf405]KQT24066.1 hypothetical protein ASG22_08580 [Chryseobacterium sp. Leaf405]
MILLDAIYINNSGGKVLLDYLISELEKTDKEVFYLLDIRIKHEGLKIKSTNEIIYLQSSLIKRRNFYKKNKTKFSTILCFGNLPPNIKTSAKVYTYFHQLLFLDLPKDISFVKKKIYYIKTRILNNFKKNTDYWIVQTGLVKEKLSQKYNIPESIILELPFYPPFKDTQTVVQREKHTYVFVSNAAHHKNHIKLIDAFCKFYDISKKGELIITVSETFTELYQMITEKQNLGYPIKNLGFINRNELKEIYLSHEYLIFPSLAESFGLGLVEAIDNGCKVIGADLPYTYEVCDPSIIFNPNEEQSIIDALLLSLKSNIKPSTKRITNNIKQFITLLHENKK